MSDTAALSAEETATGYAKGGEEEGALRRRLLGVGATILVEIAIIALLLTLGWNLAEDRTETPIVTTLDAQNFAESEPAAEEPTQPETPPQPQSAPSPRPPDLQPFEPPEEPVPTPLDPPVIIQPRQDSPPSPPRPTPSPAPRQPADPPARVYGPPDTGPPGGSFDSQRVGTAPNGEPMYAARWYREPTRQELAGYLSTATGPGSALIVCRTVPDFYVEDCELLGESPRGSQMGRAVLAAAWQFRVRPAIVGGRSQVGSWVRIRIDYTRTQR
ncbi:hypothetical protein [Erythrobacter sp. YT30]|uniref:hypothetical protein n=1 Tax=Erythrobacter sp. YT30 TaxID=1735012 RepID=UPI000B1FE495|nr:hypothetical protein [Erythrobacter sp. YT30]